MNRTYLGIAAVIVLIIVIVGAYFLFSKPAQGPVINTQQSSVQEQNVNPSSYQIQGMKIDIRKEGTGEAAKTGDLVTVNYTGSLTNGTKFDSSVDPSFGHVSPFQFTLGKNRVIQGWELGVLGMKIGEKRKLTIPPELGYGASGAGSLIPPNATLVFEVDLLGIN